MSCSKNNILKFLLYSFVFSGITIDAGYATQSDQTHDDILKSVDDHISWRMLKSDVVECGESHSDRIIGGDSATLGQYPWLARLGYKEINDVIMYKCGGSLINKRFVLTAAHCVMPSEPITVKLGEHDTRSRTDCSNGECAELPQDRDVSRIRAHEDYNNPKFANDIALIQLDEDVNYNGWVGPVCLPKLGVSIDYSGAVETAGWGLTDMDTYKVADVLQTLTVPMVPIEHCQKFYRKQVVLTDHQLCASGIVNRDTCGGDSGGPLMQVSMGDSIPQNFLVGVVSFGPTICGGTSPGVFVNTVHYLRWILDNMKEMSEEY